MSTKKKLLDDAIKDTGALLQFLFDKLPTEHHSHKSITLLLSRWQANKAVKASGTQPLSDYRMEKNQVLEALHEWIQDADEASLSLLSLPKALPKEVNKILVISMDEEEEQKMEELFTEFPKLDFDTCVSSDIPDTTPYSIIVFDNYSLGPVKQSTFKNLPTEGQAQLMIMAEWLKRQSKGPSSSIASPGLIIHYGKYCFLLDGYNNCVAANFPFTLYGVIKQILEYWERG